MRAGKARRQETRLSWRDRAVRVPSDAEAVDPALDEFDRMSLDDGLSIAVAFSQER